MMQVNYACYPRKRRPPKNERPAEIRWRAENRPSAYDEA